MRRTVPFLLLFIGLMLLIPGATATDEEFNATITEDGHITWNAGFTRDNTSNLFYMGTPNGAIIHRGYVEWDISGLPNRTINQVYLYYHGNANQADVNVTLLTNRPSITADNVLYWEIGTGNSTIIASEAGFPVASPQQAIAIDAAGLTALQNAIIAGQTWFAAGFRSTDEVGPGDTRTFIYTEESPVCNPPPTLYVEFLGNFTYIFNGGYYENGTVYGSVDISYTTPTDDGQFEVNGSQTKYFNVEPIMFYWDIGGGYSRYVFSYGEENFTVTIPEDTFYVYSFTIKDHTGKTGMGDTFLEAYRTINGTETLIERMKLYIGNPIPLNLVYGRTYHLRVLFADGSRYDWGYFVAGAVDEINLVLKAVTFTDQAQILYNHIHVEATRNPAGTLITTSYEDDRENTVWANVTIRVRNGGIVLFAARNNDTYIVNWAGADAALGYVVTVTGLHDDYGTWGRSFILDADEDYPAAPSLVGIFGDVHPDLIAYGITLVSLLTFSVAFHERGLLATMFIASVLRYIGWASWSYNLVAFGWFLAIGVALTQGGKS